MNEQEEIFEMYEIIFSGKSTRKNKIWFGALAVSCKYCASCGKFFVIHNERQRFCSEECRKKKGRMPWPKGLREKVMIRDEHTCRYCGDRAEHVDHVIPVSKGGGYEIENLVASCISCNLIANGKLFDSFEAKRLWLRKYRRIPDDVKMPEPKEENRPSWHSKIYGSGENQKNP